MLKSPYLLAIAVLLAILQWTSVARAQESTLALTFDLPPANRQTATSASSLSISAPDALAPTASEPEPTEIATDLDRDLIYERKALPPIETTAFKALASVSTEASATEPSLLELTFSADTVSLENLGEEDLREEDLGEENLYTEAEDHNTESNNIEVSNIEVSNTEGNNDDVSVLIRDTYETVPSAAADNSTDNALVLDDWIFENGSNSLVARTVGSAEGTRQSDGKHTRAYYGHVDPGNGVWNLGTFSYQHGAESPEAADERQLKRLKQQGLELTSQAIALGIDLSLEEKLNGLDLANQAPLAALDQGGYIERLAQAKRLQMEGTEAILWARTYAYIDPDTRQWNAPGLGNNVHSISQDQQRRISAIAQAMKAYDPAGMDIAALGRLNQINLAGTGESPQSNETPTLMAANVVAESSDSEMAVSFVLPPSVLPSSERAIADITAAETTATRAAATETATSEAATSEAATFKQTPSPIAAVVTDEIGVTFIPTDDIAAQPAPADLSTGSGDTETATEAADVASPEPDLFSLSATEASTTEAPSEPHLQAEQASLDLAEPSEASLSSAQVSIPSETVSTQTSTRISGQADETSKAKPEDVETENAETENLNDNSATKLQSLLAGIEPTELIDISRLNPEATQSESQSSLWRIEDKIVPEKR